MTRDGLVPRDDLALAAMHHRLGRRPAGLAPHQEARPPPFDGAAAPAARRGRTDARRCRCVRNGSRSEPSPSTTSSGRPSTRPQDFHSRHQVVAVARHEQRHRKAASRCSSITAVAAGSSPSARQHPHADAAKLGDRHADVHADAAHRAPQHDAIAIELDLPDLSVRAAVARRIAHGQGEGVEPQRAARPERGPNTHLTPQTLPAGLLCPVVPRSCRRGGRNRLKGPG